MNRCSGHVHSLLQLEAIEKMKNLLVTGILLVTLCYQTLGQDEGDCTVDQGTCSGERQLHALFGGKEQDEMRKAFERVYSTNPSLFEGGGLPNVPLERKPPGPCSKTCWFFSPKAVYDGRQWWLTVCHLSWCQYWHVCRCNKPTTCSGTMAWRPQNINWLGDCRIQERWVRIYVWRPSIGLKYRWFRLKSDCCCIPRGFIG